MNKEKYLWMLFPAVILGIFLIYFSAQNPAKLLPKPTEVVSAQREDATVKQNRKQFIEQMHKSAPDIDWRKIDQQTRKAKALARMQALQSQTMLRGDNPLFSRDTVAKG